MQFSDILAQPVAVRQLQTALTHNKLSHCYVFSGPDGVGKYRTALTLAAALLCTHATDKPCGVCDACRQVQGGTHPDLMVLHPDGATIRIEQVRALQKRLSRNAYSGGYTVVIIDDAAQLSIAAANAFLKTLEEPFDAVLFILVTAAPEQLPATILSRAQQIRFQPLPAAAIQQMIARYDTGDPARQALAVHLAAGSAGEALRLLQADADTDSANPGLDAVAAEQDALYRLLARLAEQHPGDLLRYAQDYRKSAPAVRRQLLFLRTFCRDLLADRLANQPAATQAAAHVHAAEQWPTAAVFKMIDETERAFARLTANCEPSLVLAVCLQQAALMIQDV